MIFTYKRWNDFCRKLHDKGLHSIPAREVNSRDNYIVLKHDVETNVKKAYELARIESKFGHRGSYYVQVYLMEDQENVDFLKKIQDMGHEISYHYDVMDSCKGNLEKAVEEFERNVMIFEKNGFKIVTLCQHGNPIVERVGYSSNRDFFRNEDVRKKYPLFSDIMVNYKEQYNTEYSYYSDAGRKFKLIYDPINNDIVKSDDKDIVYKDLDAVLESLKNGNYIISTHPHRWTKSAVVYIIKTAIFKAIRFAAKLFAKVPLVKKIMSKYYYLAKKI